MDHQMELAQYHLVNWTSSTFTREEMRIGREETNVSIIALEFTFQRRTGFFLLQVRNIPADDTINFV